MLKTHRVDNTGVVNQGNLHIHPHVRQHIVMNRDFKHWCSTISPISTKLTPSFHLNSLKKDHDL